MIGPTDYEYQVLKNQVDIMEAITILLGKAVADRKDLKPIVEDVYKDLVNDANETAGLMTELMK